MLAMPRKHKSDSESSSVKSETSKKAKTLPEQRHKVEKLYGMSMPKDFFQFWEFCEKQNALSPTDALKSLNLALVGPFYFMQDSTQSQLDKEPSNYHLHWRYHYDCPEFLTVLNSTSKNSLFHIGYFRDDPHCLDSVVVASNSGEDARLNVLGDNIFAAVRFEIKKLLKTCDTKTKKILVALEQAITEYTTKNSISLEQKSDQVKSREKRIVTKSFHGAGIVVPISEGEVGYRPLHHTNVQLKKLLKNIEDAKNDGDRIAAFEPMQQMVNFVQFANDECDYGMGLELGIDLFCNGSKYFHKMAGMLLTMAYSLLNRELYGKICEKHLSDRRKTDVSRL